MMKVEIGMDFSSLPGLFDR